MKVNEIFGSVQGEGPAMGDVVTFVRLSGCNLMCEGCDAVHQDGINMSVSDVVEVCRRMKNDVIIITGGEPFIQPEVYDLISALDDAGFVVDVETNGTQSIMRDVTWNVRYFVVSPKRGYPVSKSGYEIYWHTLDEILDGVETVLPDAGIPYYFITGNHDHSVFKVIGADFGRLLSERRKDVRYLGYSSGLVTLPGGIRAMLYHGNGGCGQFHGTRLQKKAEYVIQSQLADRKKIPDLFVSGHCHKSSISPNISGMFCIATGCFQSQTPHLSSIGLIPEQSAFIIEYIKKDDRYEVNYLKYFGYKSYTRRFK